MSIVRLALTPRHLIEWSALMPPLDKIVADYLEQIEQLGGAERWLTTSLYRTPAEDAALGGSGIHCTNRAVDIISQPWNQKLADAATAVVNTRWMYDPTRTNLRCVISAMHGTGAHVHIQVHLRTRRAWDERRTA